MRARAVCAIFLALIIGLAGPRASLAQQPGAHQGRARSATHPNPASGREVVAPPYFYGGGYGYPFLSTGASYGNPYISRSSGCCHGRN
ncbi:MAG: hypothetical protein JO137_17150 [Hyphomicrobiales bacterium]|nr:hypothetical protein [Hyphomicrobiales bacterium]